MPAKTLLEIRTRAKDLILDTDDITDAMVDEWIQDAQEELEDRHGFRAMQTTHDVNTTVATRKLDDLPSDWCRERAKPGYIDSSDKTKFMDWILHDQELHRLYDLEDTDDDGSPGHIMVDEADSQFDVFPLPDGNGPVAGEYAVRIPYYKRLLTLTSDAHTNWFTDQAQGVRFLEFYAAAQGADFNRDREAEIGFLAKAEAVAQKLIGREKKKAIQRTTVLRPRSDVLAPASQGRMT